MCGKPTAGEKVVAVRCQPKTYPCPTCGRRGHRKRRLDRFVRSLAYGHVLWLHLFYAEYTARCDCRKYFRSCPPGICPKADYDNLVRQAVLNRILDDGLNVERTREAMKRDTGRLPFPSHPLSRAVDADERRQLWLATEQSG